MGMSLQLKMNQNPVERITTITRADAKTVHQAVDEAMREVAMRFGLEYMPKGGSFNPTEWRTTVRMAVPVSESKAVVPATTRAIQSGLGKRGDRVCVASNRKGLSSGMITEVRRSNYTVTFENGKVYLVPFSSCSAFNDAPGKKRTESEIVEEIAGVYHRLEPENLTCDGELSTAEVTRKRRSLGHTLMLLQSELGRTVTEEEAYNYASR